MIKYVKGDATKPIGDGPKIITHIVNDEGLWGAGFVLAVDRLSARPKRIYQGNHAAYIKQGFTFSPLGMIEVVPVAPNIYVCNMTAQHRTIRTIEKPICYKSLKVCLAKLTEYAIAEGATVHMPRIGCGLA